MYKVMFISDDLATGEVECQSEGEADAWEERLLEQGYTVARLELGESA